MEKRELKGKIMMEIELMQMGRGPKVGENREKEEGWGMKNLKRRIKTHCIPVSTPHNTYNRYIL